MGGIRTGDDSNAYAAGFAAGKAAGMAAASEIVASHRDSAGSALETTADAHDFDEQKTESGAAKRAYVTGFAAGIAAALVAQGTSGPSHPASVSAEVEQDLSYLDQPAGEWNPKPVTDPASEVAGDIPALTEEDLGHIAPGCFVQVGSGEHAYWVEIGQIDGATISGIVHPELSGTLCIVNHDSCEIARFNRNEITALGCDRYCWC